MGITISSHATFSLSPQLFCARMRISSFVNGRLQIDINKVLVIIFLRFFTKYENIAILLNRIVTENYLFIKLIQILP